MAAQKLIERIGFFLRAKGRHGTHSPFVYHFIEKVLRNKIVAVDQQHKLSKKDWQLLNSTLLYINPNKIFFEDNAIDIKWLSSIAQKSNCLIKPINEADNLKMEDNVFVILKAKALSEVIFTKLKTIHSAHRISIYIICPHDVSSYTIIDQLKNLSEFKMVLDFWQGLLLVKRSEFKEKQFFELR